MTDYEDCTYHGLQHRPGEWQPARIVVETAAPGPTQREKAEVLRELRPFDHPNGEFGWGYNGGGTSRTAAAVLGDALGIDEGDIAFAGSASPPLARLREDFCEEVLSQLCDEWRLRRGAILRWVRGWYAQWDVAQLPPAVAKLPPIEP